MRISIEKENKVNWNPAVPINQNDFLSLNSSCFSKEWDVTTKECQMCAERDTCGILMRQTNKAKADKVEAELGSKFIDTSDFRFTGSQIQSIIDWVDSGNTSTVELVNKVLELANSSDQVAGIENTKRLIKSTPNLYTQNGKVWKR